MSDARQIGFLLIEDFSMICIATMINPFRSANRLLGYTAYDWYFLTHDDQAVTASDGLQAPSTCPIASSKKFDYFFVCAGLDFDPPYRAKLNSSLRHLSQNSTVFGALCTGSFILARAGYLDTHNFTLHWENQPAFEEEFPNLKISPNLYVTDGNRWTGSGGLSSMDMALKIIEDDHGTALASAVGNQYQVDRLRGANIGQRPSDLQEYDTLPKALQTAINLMQSNMETPLPIPKIAEGAGTTIRTLERLFAKHLTHAPAGFYRHLRLERARYLLWHTNISILEIAFITGFSSPSYLSRMYHAHYGKMPSDERK